MYILNALAANKYANNLAAMLCLTSIVIYPLLQINFLRIEQLTRRRKTQNIRRVTYTSFSRDDAMPYHQIHRTISQSLRLRNKTLQQSIKIHKILIKKRIIILQNDKQLTKF